MQITRSLILAIIFRSHIFIAMSLKRSISSGAALEPTKQAKIEIFAPSGFNTSRVRVLTKTTKIRDDSHCVAYWMFRDQRVNDNYALLYAQAIAKAKNVPLKVFFNLAPTFLDSTMRQYGFMLAGLQEVEQQLRDLNIPFYLTIGKTRPYRHNKTVPSAPPLIPPHHVTGDAGVNVPRFVREQSACALVGDFSPLREPRAWALAAAHALDGGPDPAAPPVPYFLVDAHNVVPCWVTSGAWRPE